jgi:hypothetical protein
MFLSIANIIRSFEIPEEWKKDVQRLKERGKEISPKDLLREKSEEIKKKTQERVIKQPGLFLRDLHRLLSYIEKDIQDPTKHGLVQELSNLANQISSEARKGEAKLPAEDQVKFLTTAERLKDDGTLLSMLSSLFSEQYKIDQRPVRKLIHVARLLRNIISFLSLENLKEYLARSVEILSEDSKLKPIIIREILENKNLQKEGLKLTLGKLKEIIKGYDPSSRQPFQKIILEPIQNFFNETIHFIPTEMFEIIKDQKKIIQKSEKELSEAKKHIKEDETIPFPKVLANKLPRISGELFLE